MPTARPINHPRTWLRAVVLGVVGALVAGIAPARALVTDTVTWSASAPTNLGVWNTVSGVNVAYASAASGLPVTYSTSSSAVCSVTSAGLVTGLSGGNCTVRAATAGDGTYAAANASRTFVIDKADQTISWSPTTPTASTAWKTYASTSFTYATATSGLTVSYSSVTPTVCSMSTAGLLTGRTPGTCTLRATQAGNTQYAAAAAADISITLLKSAQTLTVTWAQPTGTTQNPYTGLWHPLTWTTTSGLLPTPTNLTPTVCVGETGAFPWSNGSGQTATARLRPVGPGRCEVVWRQAGDTQWEPSNEVTMTIDLVLGPVVDNGYTGPRQGAERLEGTSWTGWVNTGGLVTGVTYAGRFLPFQASTWEVTTSDPTICTTGTPKLRPGYTTLYDIPFNHVDGGRCDVQFTTTGPAGIYPRSTRSFSYQVLATQTFTLADPTGPLTAGDRFTMSPRVDSGLTVRAVSLDPNVCSFGTTQGATANVGVPAGTSVVLRLWASGTCQITYSNSGDADLNSYDPMSGTWAPFTETRTYTIEPGRYPITVQASPTRSGTPASTVAMGKTLYVWAIGISGYPETASMTTTGDCTIARDPVNTPYWILRPQHAGSTCAVTAVVTKTGYTDGTDTLTVTTERGTQTLTDFTATGPGASTDVFDVGTTARLDVTASSGLAGEFSVSTDPDSTAICSVTGTTVTFLSHGTCRLIARQPGDDDWFAAAPVYLNLTVRKPQSLVLRIDGDATPLDATFDLDPTTTAGRRYSLVEARATSGLPVTLSVVSGPCEVVNLLMVKVDLTASLDSDRDCVLRATQDGAGEYHPVEDTGTLHVRLPRQTITATNVRPIVSDIFAAPASTGTPNDVVVESTSTGVCETLDLRGAPGPSRWVEALHTGTCTLTATARGGWGYLAATPVELEVRIYAASQSIAFELMASSLLSLTEMPLQATATSGLPVRFTTNDPTICRAVVRAGEPVLLMDRAGDCVVTAHQDGDSDWAPADPVERTIVLAKATQIIDVTAPTEVGVLAGQLPVYVTTSSGLPVTIDDLDAGTVCTVISHPTSGEPLVDIRGFGTCRLYVAQAGSDRFHPAWTTVAFEVTKHEQIIDFDPSATVVPADHAPWDQQLTARYQHWVMGVSTISDSFMPTSLSSMSTDTCAVTGSTVTLLRHDPRGAADAVCRLGAVAYGDDWFATTGVVREVTLERRDQTLIFTPSATSYVMGVDPDHWDQDAIDPQAGISSTITSADTAVCTVTGATVTATRFDPQSATDPVCPLVATNDGNWLWRPANTTLDVTLARRDQTLAFTPSVTSYLMGVDPDRWAQGAEDPVAQLPAVIESTTTRICVVDGGDVVSTHFDPESEIDPVCSLTASHPGSWMWRPAAPVTLDVTLARRDQTFTFDPALTTRYLWRDAPSFDQFAGDRTSPLPPTVISDTTRVCTVTGGRITLHDGGTCNLRAWNSGDWRYRPTDLAGSFKVIVPATTAVVFDPKPPTELHVSTAPFALGATASSGEPVEVFSTTPAICTYDAGVLTPTYQPGTCEIGYRVPAVARETEAFEAAAGTFTIEMFRWVPRLRFTPAIDDRMPLPATPFDWNQDATNTSPYGTPPSPTLTITGACATADPGVARTPTGPGVCSFEASAPGDADFEPVAISTTTEFYEATSTPTKQYQQIVYDVAPSTRNPADPPFPVAFRSVSFANPAVPTGLAVTVRDLTPLVCTYDETTELITLTGREGECWLRPVQAGDDDWYPAYTLDYRFDVVRTRQYVTFWPGYTEVQWQNDAYPFEARATADSPVGRVPSTFPLTLEVLTPEVCSWTNGMLTLGDPYTVCTVRASVTGDIEFAPAWNVISILVVGEKTTTTTTIRPFDPPTTPPTLPPAPTTTIPGGGDGNTGVTIPGDNTGGTCEPGLPCQSTTTTTTTPDTPTTTTPTTSTPPTTPTTTTPTTTTPTTPTTTTPTTTTPTTSTTTPGTKGPTTTTPGTGGNPNADDDPNGTGDDTPPIVRIVTTSFALLLLLVIVLLLLFVLWRRRRRQDD